jgi:cytochrome b subunit of formate dehydrogenase
VIAKHNRQCLDTRLVKPKKKTFNKGKILIWLGYVALIIFVIWFVTGIVMDYYSHIGVDVPISP